MQKIGIRQAMSGWYHRNFSNPEAVSLFLTLVFGLLFFELFGSFFMPVIVSVVLAYLLLMPVKLLNRMRFPKTLSVIIVFTLFVGLVIFLSFVLLPLIWRQLAALISSMPSFFMDMKQWVAELTVKYPKVISSQWIQHVVNYLQQHTTSLAQYLLSFSLTLIPGVIQIVLYLIMVPLLLFFFLKDASLIIQFFDPYLPKNRTVLSKVVNVMNAKIGAYIRGRVLEIFILGVTCFIAFASLGLRYPILLSSLVGLGCLIPYVGAVLVSIPVIVVALMQWGLGTSFVYLIIVYAIIQALDANILVPLLFAEALSLHPVVIILACIIFGGIWGFWGIFFAIPLASLVWEVLQAWPQHEPPLAMSCDSDTALAPEDQKQGKD